jgi:bla regulator protein blaR1
MNHLWIYLLKSGLALWMFYGVYWFFLRKETFFSLNRIVLLGSLALSFILPFLRIENLFTLSGNTAIPSFFMDFGEQSVTSTGSSVGTLDFKGLLTIVAMIIYLSGIVFLGERLIYQMIRLFRLSKKYPVTSRDGMGLIYVNENIAPCSFFRHIFIHTSMKTDDKLEQIILHESAHVKNLHFIDLILFGLAGIIHWFNPVMWLFERSIREVHEFEADREVLKHEPDKGIYQALLVNQVTGIEIFKLANSFSKSITKKRMIMMSKMRSGKLSSAKVLVVLPIILCLVFAFSKPQVIGKSSQNLQPKHVMGKVTDAKSNESLSGAAVLIEGTTEGTVTGEDGKYMIDLSGGEQVLVFSYVGYETQRIKADRPEINVKMQKKVYDLPEDEVLKPGEEITSEKDKELFMVVEEMPSFEGKGGEGFREYLAKNIVYPEEAKKNSITGKVYVQFTVNTKGEVVDVKVVRSVSPSLDKEAVRVVESSPLWEPGKQKGKPVDVQFTFPIEFKLN